MTRSAIEASDAPVKPGQWPWNKPGGRDEYASPEAIENYLRRWASARRLVTADAQWQAVHMLALHCYAELEVLRDLEGVDESDVRARVSLRRELLSAARLQRGLMEKLGWLKADRRRSRRNRRGPVEVDSLDELGT